MKAYGLPRNLDIEFPDLVDIHHYALKTSTGQIKSKGGDFRGSVKTKNRNKLRRIWKKSARASNKVAILKEITHL